MRVRQRDVVLLERVGYTSMMAARTREKLTFARYVALADASPSKLELWAGEVIDMAGGTPAHADLAANILGLLFGELRDKPCRASTSDLRVARNDADFAAYPDVTVTCGKRELRDGDELSITNPTVLFEVSSPSTEAYDRGQKFAQYRQLPSLREYVLVSHVEPSIEVFTRADGGAWLLRVYREGERARLSSIDATLPVDEVYRGVELEQRGR